MPKSWYSIGFFLSFLITTGVLQWFQESQYPKEVWIILGILAGVFVMFSLIGRCTQFIRSDVFAFLLVLVCGVGISFFRVAETTHITSKNSVEYYASEHCRDEGSACKEITVHGFIAEEPDRRPMKTKYTVKVDEIISRSSAVAESHGSPLRVDGKILVTDYSFYPPHAYGDEVLVSGILERPTQIEDFQYDRFLSRYGVYGVVYRGSVQTVSIGHGNAFFSFLYGLKQRFESQLNRLYPEPHASFMAGLLTGSRRGIPAHLLADFQATGLTHIIAISGYNISIVIAIVSSSLFFLPLKWRFVPAISAIIFFTLFVGASPSVVRAAIMGALGLFALQVGRQKHSLIVILFTAFLMVLWNPKFLWYDAGFQLSFLSVMGLAYLSPFLDRLFAWAPQTFGIRESLQMTVAAQLAAVPLVIALFGQFSVVSPLANVLVAPFIPLAMLFGFLGALVSYVSMPFGLLIAYPGWGALQLVIRITQFFANLPYASLATPDVALWMIGAYYSIFVVALLLPLIHKHLRPLVLGRTHDMPRR